MQVYEDHDVAAALRLPLMNLDRTLGLVEAFCQNTHKRLNTPSPEPKIGLSLTTSQEIQSGLIGAVREALCRSVRVSGGDRDAPDAGSILMSTTIKITAFRERRGAFF